VGNWTVWKEIAGLAVLAAGLGVGLTGFLGYIVPVAAEQDALSLPGLGMSLGGLALVVPAIVSLYAQAHE
jgi:hypothetical protein